MNIYAWAAGMDAEETLTYVERFPQLKYILYPRNYDAVLELPGKQVAYVTSVNAAERIISNPDKWEFAILGDEPNIVGHSGSRIVPPEEYVGRYTPVHEVLNSAGIKTSSAGLGMKPNGSFDSEYAKMLDELGFADYRAVNYSPVQYRQMSIGIKVSERKWMTTILPVRANWTPLKYNTVFAWLWQTIYQPSITRQINTLSKTTIGIGIWCLREVRMNGGEWQGWHGLVDRNGRETWQGRMINRILS